MAQLVPAVSNNVLTLLTDENKNKTKTTENRRQDEESSEIPDVQAKENEDRGWKTQKKRGFNRKVRPAPVQGNKDEETTLKVATKSPKYSWLFLSGLSEDSTTQEVQSYLKDNGVETCIIEKLRTKRQHVSCFKMGIPEENEPEVMAADFWPKGLFINKFLNLKHLVPHLQRRGEMGQNQA